MAHWKKLLLLPLAAALLLAGCSEPPEEVARKPQVVELIDVMPTILDLFGVPAAS